NVSTYINTNVPNFNYGLLSLNELNTLRAIDLHIALGDLNQDRSITAADIDLVLHNAGNAAYDIDGDGQTNRADADMLVQTILNTRYGDANLDHRVNALDFSTIASNFGQSGGWAQGDFNGDGLINSLDFTALAGNFGFNNLGASAPGAALVPEASILPLLAG